VGPSAPGTGRLPVLLLGGPTGVGKTDWAIELAESAPIEIVSVDSAMVYRGLDIGTAKPQQQVRARIPHHLIDLCDPAENYSAGRFVGDALEAIRGIHARRRVPLLVGGTMLYLRALLDGLAELPEANPKLRAELDAQAAGHGWPSLHAELARVDPVAAARIAPNDGQRIQRALEVYRATGQPISALQQATVSPLARFEVRYFLIRPPDRTMLHLRIAQRLEAMMAAGFLDEVRRLRDRGDLTAAHSSMRSVGYRQVWGHLEGRYDLREAVDRALAATRQLAKRQLTWMRGERRGLWLDPDARVSWKRDICHELSARGL